MVLFLNTLAWLLGLLIVIVAIPPIVRASHAKSLFDPINSRKIHTEIIPPMGGVAIFLGFLLSTIIATGSYVFFELKYIIAGVIVMFFTGLKDDILEIRAGKKFVLQIVASLILITLGGIRITSLHGIFGIYELHYFIGMLLTLLIMLSIINAYNLIDGIDGLASGLAIMASAIFGFWFYITGHAEYSIVSFALSGSLSGFFIYNVFGKKNKLFMGDTGSLVIGLLIAVLTIKFNQFNIIRGGAYSIVASPTVSFAVVIIPLVDMLRVMTLRILNGRSPFVADNNHIHHRILALVPNHFKVTLIMIVANAIFVGLAFFVNYISFNVTLQFLLVFSLAIILSFLPSQLVRIRQTKLVRIREAKVKKKNALVRQYEES